MAGGWSKDGAVQDQIDASVDDAISQVRNKIPHGKSLTHCEECGEAIPLARQKAIAGVRYCVSCQSNFDQQEQKQALFNRRGSKGSQLK
jgi:phage/conjugal plasmid C-4 type zinc finger TraR family protein